MAELTVYPDANPESTSVDGVVYQWNQNKTWANIHDATDGTNVQDSSSSSVNISVVSASTTSNQWANIWRSIFLFDTSALGAGVTINSAVFSVYVEGKSDSFSDAIALIDTNPASNTGLVVGDYTDGVEIGTTKQATNLNISSISTSAYNNWTLNAAGLASISKTGITKFGLRNESDRADSAPSWGSNSISRIYGVYADNATNKPKLVIQYTEAGTDYTLAVTVGTFTLTGITTLFSKGYNLVATVGAFTLTGIAVLFGKAISMIASVGTFTLTGIAVVLQRGMNLITTVGSFILTGIDVAFGDSGSWKVTNQSKSTPITPTNQSQHNIDPTGQSKSSDITFKNREKS